MRLIDADALGELVSHGVVHYEDILAQPTVDAVPVIRCNDCRYFCSYSDGTYACDSYFGMVTDSAEGYCSQAERKDDIVIIHPEDIVFNSEEDEKAYYEALGAERKEE